MELEFDVKMTPNALFDYLLYHTYTGLSGILGTVAGLFLVAAFLRGYSPVYLGAGLFVILYLPVTLFFRSRKQFLNNPAFREPIHFQFDDTGMTVSQGEVTTTQEWEFMVKAVSTPRSIILYTSRVNASIFPKEDLGENRVPLIRMISTHMDPKKVRIRGN